MEPFFVFLNVEDFLRKGVKCADCVGGHEAEILFTVMDFAPEFCGNDLISCCGGGDACDEEHSVLSGGRAEGKR